MLFDIQCLNCKFFLLIFHWINQIIHFLGQKLFFFSISPSDNNEPSKMQPFMQQDKTCSDVVVVNWKDYVLCSFSLEFFFWISLLLYKMLLMKPTYLLKPWLTVSKKVIFERTYLNRSCSVKYLLPFNGIILQLVQYSQRNHSKKWMCIFAKIL